MLKIINVVNNFLKYTIKVKLQFFFLIINLKFYFLIMKVKLVATNIFN